MDDGLAKPKNKVWLFGVLILIVACTGIVFAWIKHGSLASSKLVASGPVTITQKVLDNKFGWLGGGAEDTGEGIIERGGLWVRPHPGAFVWDMMQKSKDDEIDFTLSDQEVNNFQKNGIAIMATLWPFADWDQKNLANASDCMVSSNDEFLPKNDKKGRGSYLPQYRCNPSDWIAYQKWVTAVVERYDGDGVSDMPGLTMPISYWEVMNEPDLQFQNVLPAGETDRLNFYKQGPNDYGQLLIETNQAIKSADSKASVLIAGAAGGEDRNLNFYKGVFTNKDTLTAFDIGNVHCISNDQTTHDFNVGTYKKMLTDFGVIKPIWVTEAEAMYGTTGEENYQSTKTSVAGAIMAGAERIFFTRYDFDDTRTDMSKIGEKSNYPSVEKYQTIINDNN